MLTIEIETDSAAFFPTASDRDAEIARILRDLANRIDCDGEISRTTGGWRWPIRDVNGNRVGWAKYE